ncbi:MAG: ATP synthase F1 subunit delta [Muribaculaceae bacterium]|nr:ATP synthase F1 subunit delta [Muribaculaceae bacterium]
MDKGLIPRRYAKALYEVAAGRSADASVYALMQKLSDAFAAEKELGSTVANPFIATADKVKLLTEAAGGAEAAGNAMYQDFLKLLAQNKRLDMARDIALAYIALYRKEHSIYRVSVVSAAPLGSKERERLEAVIAKHVGEGTMEYDYTVDPALIGGFTVTVNSERLDASVANTLKQMRLQLLG